jgi:hypothetical protein
MGAVDASEFIRRESSVAVGECVIFTARRADSRLRITSG